MTDKVLYLGDTALDAAASYLAGVMLHCNIPFDYIDSATKCTDKQLDQDYCAVIISDYPSTSFRPEHFEQLITKTRSGTGLIMIGGWESFTGLGGDYDATPLAEILPVEMQDADDRVNSFSPCMIKLEAEHPIAARLPFVTQSVAINGYNRLCAKPTAKTILSVKRYCVSLVDDDFDFSEQSVDPLLVVGQEQNGRVACYAGDVAPHWAGGFVDWGDHRHVLQAGGAGEVEIGNWYIEFFGNLIKWVSRQI
ncbi:glutamine amidotransferase [Pirellulaceae bacterium]|nr:glutamine amidotransferase [Pirellulaceae bacterium]